MDTTVFLLMGGIGGIMFDMFYSSLGFEGFNTTLQTCPRLKQGDIVQIALESMLLLGSLYTSSDKMQAFAAGALFGGLIPKFAALYGSRYILFEFDPSTGAITPNIRQTGG